MMSHYEEEKRKEEEEKKKTPKPTPSHDPGLSPTQQPEPPSAPTDPSITAKPSEASKVTVTKTITVDAPLPSDPLNDIVQVVEWKDPRPNGAKHTVTVHDLTHDRSQYVRYHAVCTCGFEARCQTLNSAVSPEGIPLNGVDFFIDQHSATHGAGVAV